MDGGNDESAAYLRGLRNTKFRNRLRILEQPHRGVTATLNRLLEETRTSWLVRMDADDISYPLRIERILHVIAQHPNAGLIYSLADYHPRQRCVGRFRCSRGNSEQLRSIVESGYLLSICHSTVALNVEKARAAGGYRMDIHAEDADLWWRMARRHEIRLIPEALVGFRQNSGSVSARNLDAQEVAGLYVQYLLLSELWNLEPQPLPIVGHVLAGFLQPSATAAKEALRRFNMQLAQGHRLRGLAALAEAAWESPRYLARRIRDEVRSSPLANGVEPRLFWERKDALWNGSKTDR